jgi:hypothetical protein
MESRAPHRRPHRAEPSRAWSATVTKHSNALDLAPRVFTLQSPHAIAASLKRSAETSTRRKGTSYQSAMSMLTFYINRAGKKLDRSQRRVLERAKDELRALFGKPAGHQARPLEARSTADRGRTRSARTSPAP